MTMTHARTRVPKNGITTSGTNTAAGAHRALVSFGYRTGATISSEKVTTKKVRVVRTDAERNLLMVRGSLPGARGGLILVKKAQ